MDLDIPHTSRFIVARHDGYAFGTTWYRVETVVRDLDDANAALADILSAVAASHPAWIREASPAKLQSTSRHASHPVFLCVHFIQRSVP